MEAYSLTCFTLCILALAGALVYVVHASLRERAAERQDFLSELRRKVYLAKGATADEAANAILTERTVMLQAEHEHARQALEIKRLAKSMPIGDSKPETLPNKLTVKGPGGQTMNLERI